MAVNTYYLFDCTSGRTQTQSLTAGKYNPGCDQTGGTWRTVSIDDGYAFNVQNLSKTELGNAFGAGYIILATALVASFGVRIIVKFVRDLF